MTRARQGLAATERDQVGLAEERQATVTAELQDARVVLDRLRILLDVSQRKLLLTRSDLGAADVSNQGFSIIRTVGDRQETILASELTALAPGDILRVGSPGSAMPPDFASHPAAAAPMRLSFADGE